MLPRLGHVLYYLGSGLAATALVAGVFILQHGLDSDYRWAVYGTSVGGAVLFWLIGRGANTFWPASKSISLRPRYTNNGHSRGCRGRRS